jgi:hypothetical protein
MWYAYCFSLDATAGVKDHKLEPAVAAFSDAMLSYFNGEGRWVRSTARMKNGGIEVWYSLSKLPAEKPFNEFWRARLLEHGLIAARVTGRS